MCVGESTTALGGDDCYPALLEEVLNKAGTGRRFLVFNRGVPGGTSTSIMEELEANLDALKPTVVVAMMGANDLPRGATPFTGGSSRERPSVFDLVKSLKLVGFLFELWEKRLQAPPDSTVARTGHALDAEVKLEQFVEQPRLEGVTDVPKSPRIKALFYVEQGDSIAWRGQQGKAIELYAWAAKTDPHCSVAYLRLAEFFTGTMQLNSVRGFIKKALESDPDGFKPNYAMARFLVAEGKNDEARVHFTKAVDNTAEVKGMDLLSLAWAYDGLGRVQDAEATLQRFLKTEQNSLLNDQTLVRYPELIDLLEHHRESAGKIVGLITVRRQPIPQVLRFLACCYTCEGNADWAEELQQNAVEAQRKFLLAEPATQHNYLLLSKILQERGIRLVAVQYPGRSLTPLRQLFPPDESVTFVDNEASFHEAISRRGFRALFWDDIYGDFGHGTREGNRIIAENVARVILHGSQR